MSMHLFSTPVECTQCGTVVDDPKLDRCPKCEALLKERRTPARLAGVERKYGNIRFLLGVLRFLGVATALVGILLFIFAGEDGTTLVSRVLLLLGSLVTAVAIWVGAGFFDIAMDIEENTRATFRVMQQTHDHEERHEESAPPV